MAAQETKQGPKVSLAGLVDASIARFRSNKRDVSGFNTNSLSLSVRDVVRDAISKSGLTPEAILDVVEAESSLDPDLRVRIAEEAAMSDPENAKMVTAAVLTLEEINLKKPDVLRENEQRVRDYLRDRI